MFFRFIAGCVYSPNTKSFYKSNHRISNYWCHKCELIQLKPESIISINQTLHVAKGTLNSSCEMTFDHVQITFSFKYYYWRYHRGIDLELSDKSRTSIHWETIWIFHDKKKYLFLNFFKTNGSWMYCIWIIPISCKPEFRLKNVPIPWPCIVYNSVLCLYDVISLFIVVISCRSMTDTQVSHTSSLCKNFSFWMAFTPTKTIFWEK